MIEEKLSQIQAELKAPKSRTNSFGKYNYRSAEDILEAVKPVCYKHGVTLTLSDEIINLGDRFYVKSTAELSDGESTKKITAFAREEAEKKGMDGSQITGAASSYARKYALNGMFCIDDNKDPDSDEYQRQLKDAQAKDDKKKLEEWKELETVLYDMASTLGLTDQTFPPYFKRKYGVDISKATLAQLQKCQSDINAKIDKEITK